jgi:hypothetical protein
MERSMRTLLAGIFLFHAGWYMLLPFLAVLFTTRVASVVWGFGEGLGSLLGGALMQYGFRTGRIGLPWFSYLLFGLAIGTLYWALRRWGPMRIELRKAVQLLRPGHPVPIEGTEVLPAGLGADPNEVK